VKKRERAMETYLAEDWSLPEEWRLWAAGLSPPHAHMVSSDAEKFKAYHLGEETIRRNWRSAWEQWWRRTVERPPVKGENGGRAAGANGIRDTSEPFADYAERMKREGKWQPPQTDKRPA